MNRIEHHEPPPTGIEPTVIAGQIATSDINILQPKESLLLQLNALMRQPAAEEKLIEYAEGNPLLDASVIQKSDTPLSEEAA